jgi:hypothetical protein
MPHGVPAEALRARLGRSAKGREAVGATVVRADCVGRGGVGVELLAAIEQWKYGMKFSELHGGFNEGGVVARRWLRYGMWTLLALAVILAYCLAGSVWVGSHWRPNSLETRIAFFKQNRAGFDAYVTRILDGKVTSVNAEYAVPQFMIDNNVKQVIQRDGVIEITFWFMPTDAVPQLLYSPRGIEGLPNEYRNGGPGRAYWKFVPIDDKWSYCEWDD